MWGAVLSNADLAFNAAIVGLASALSILVLGFVRQTIRVRRQRSDFSLGRLETLELDRTMLVYVKVRHSLREIEQLAQGGQASFWARHRLRAEIHRRYGGERTDLQAYAWHLRANILRLRNLPIKRFRSWVHSVSAQFAFGCSLALYAFTGMILVAIFYLEQSARPQEIWSNLAELLLGSSTNPLLYANSISAAACLVVFPILYCADRARLRRLHGREMRILKDFAAVDPDLLIAAQQNDQAENAAANDGEAWSDQEGSERHDNQAHWRSTERESQHLDGPDADEWHVVLGVAHSATPEEIRRAYRAQIKQNHPDRVHGMSPIFKELAEQQTKRLNSAYEEALRSSALRSSSQGLDPAFTGASYY